LATSSNQYRVNHQIRIPRVLVIDQNGVSLGEMATDVARKLAEDAGLDLVEVNPNQRPPVCRIMDYGKFKYEQRKKRKKQTTYTIKGIRLRPKIGDHDMEVKVKRARAFLEAGNKVQVTLIFRGREMVHQDVAMAVLERFYRELEDIAKVEREPSLEGRRMTLLLARR